MSKTSKTRESKLPRRFEALASLMIPCAISSDAQLERAVDMIDRLMAAGRLSRGQEVYLETLVQLVQAYEAAHHAIQIPGGLDALKHVLSEHDLNATQLAAILGVHPSLGSKILKGERALTVDHLRALAARFKVRPDTFMDSLQVA